MPVNPISPSYGAESWRLTPVDPAVEQFLKYIKDTLQPNVENIMFYPGHKDALPLASHLYWDDVKGPLTSIFNQLSPADQDKVRTSYDDVVNNAYNLLNEGYTNADDWKSYLEKINTSLTSITNILS